MRGVFLVGAALVVAVVWAGLGQAEEPKSGLAAQRARVLAQLAKMKPEYTGHASARREGQMVRDLAESLKKALGDRPAAAPESSGRPGDASKYDAADAWLEEYEPLIHALQRKQADLYAEAIARGEQP